MLKKRERVMPKSNSVIILPFKAAEFYWGVTLSFIRNRQNKF